MLPGEVREQIARVIDPDAWEEYLLEDGRVDQEVASIFQDAYEASLAKADAIIALISNTTSAWGWQTIDSAPRDGTSFLIWDRAHGVRKGRYFYRSDNDLPWSIYQDDGVNTFKGGVQPTHWMPLPAAPIGSGHG